MKRESIHISTNDFGFFLLKKSYDFRLSEVERKIFMDKYAHALEIHFIAESNGYPVKVVEELLNEIYSKSQSNNVKQVFNFEKIRVPYSRLGNSLFFEFLQSSEHKLSALKFWKDLNTHSEKENLLLDSFLDNCLYEQYFQKVSSVTKFALAVDNLQEKIIHAAYIYNQEESYFTSKSVNAYFIKISYYTLPKIIKRFAAISHFSERDVCLSLVNRLKTADPNSDKELKDRIERSCKKNDDFTTATMQDSTSINRYTDRLMCQDLLDIMSAKLNTRDQNEKNHKDYDSVQDVIEKSNEKIKGFDKLSLEKLHRKPRLTLSYAIEKYPDISVRFPFDKLDLYAVYCFVKRSIVAFNLTNLIKLEETIAQGYLYCMEQMQKGIILNEPTNYLKRSCYKAIIENQEKYRDKIVENQKLQKFKQLDIIHQDRFEKKWNKQIELLLKKCWSEIEKELSPEMFEENILFVNAGQTAERYCQKLFFELGRINEELEDILKNSLNNPFLAIWIDECDYLLAQKLSLIDEDDCFIYAGLLANVNKYVTENLNIRLPAFLFNQTITSEKRIKSKFESRIESLKDYRIVNHTRSQQDAQSIINKQNSFFFLILICSIAKVTSESLHSHLLNIFSVSILVGTSCCLFFNQYTANNSTQQINDTKYPPESSKTLELMKQSKMHLSPISHDKRKVFKGKATWYNTDKKQETISDELFNADLMGFSLSNYLLSRRVRITNIQNNESANFRINYNFPSNSTNRIVNVSRSGAKKLGFLKQGVTTIKIEVLPPEQK